MGKLPGVAGLTTYVRQLAENWEIGGLDISEVIVSDDGRRFAAIGVERSGKALSTGKSCDMPFVWIFKTDVDGKFTYVREYNDTHTIGQTFA
jgi:ketosteroid isomerase-like protein